MSISLIPYHYILVRSAIWFIFSDKKKLKMRVTLLVREQRSIEITGKQSEAWTLICLLPSN